MYDTGFVPAAPSVSALLVATALAVASAAAYAVAAVMQERLAAHPNPAAGGGPPSLSRVVVQPRWWTSVALNGTGATLHVAALAFGPLSMVQPLGVLTLVLALPIGAAAIGRRVSAGHWRGAGATVAGLTVLLLLTAPATVGEPLGRGKTGVLVAVATALVVGLALGARAARRPAARSLLTATAAGVAFAVASALTQTLVRRATDDGPVALLSSATIALAGMATAGLLLSQLAYRDSGLGAPLATVTLVNPVTSAAIGMLLLDERTTGGAWGSLAAVAGAAVAGWGVVRLARSEGSGRVRAAEVALDPAVATPDGIGLFCATGAKCDVGGSRR
jgi:drug/metabolite transporter (DMT)-like permease